MKNAGLPFLTSSFTDRRGFVAGALIGLAPAAVNAARADRGGPALAPLAELDPGQGPVLLNGSVWEFVHGDMSRLTDGITAVRSERVPVVEGAWIRRCDRTIASIRSDTEAVPTRLSDLTDAAPRRPEEFGAVGDGVADDAPAIRRALDAITRASGGSGASTRPGVLMLTQGKRYRCGSRIVIDRRFHTVFGYATLDFSAWSGVYVQITGDQTEFGNGYGQSGSFEGQVVILGARGAAGQESVGILYETPVRASTTSIRTVGITVTRCDIAFRIGSRGYNQDFVSCKAFDCGVIFDWVKDAEDNDERVSVFGGTFYNSTLFLRHRRDAGGFYAFGCSVDYTECVADILSGKAQLFGCHLESNRWTDRPIRVSGNNGLFSMHGGWLFMMENRGEATHLFGIEAGSRAKLHDVITHNANKLRVADPRSPTTWATGAGRFELHGTEPAFEYGGFPARLHDRTSVLADPSFDEADVQINPIWRIADVNPIRSRDGSDMRQASEAAHNMTFARATRGQMEGAGCLRINKAHGAGSAAAMVIAAIPVRHGDKAGGGFRVRTAPDRPGNRRMTVRAGFAVLDSIDAHGVPVIRKLTTSADVVLTPPTDDYVLAAPGNGASDYTAPSWATHFLVVIDLFASDQASFLIDGRWADRW